MDINVRKRELSALTIPQLTQLQAAMVDEIGPSCPFPKVDSFKAKGVVISRVLALANVARKDPRWAADRRDMRRGTYVPPSGAPLKSCLQGSRQAALIDQLARREGATMGDLIGALVAINPAGKYDEKRIRTAFSWDVKGRGYGVQGRVVDGVERFFLMVPRGLVLLPHRPRKTAPKTAAPATAATSPTQE